MKTPTSRALCALFIFIAQLTFAQVQIDKDLQMVGAPGDRDITGAQTVDASVGYLFNGGVGTVGQVLRSNGSSGFVAAFLAASDIPNLDMSKITTGNLDWSRLSGVPATFPPSAGSGDYIQNQIAAAQASSNFWISGTGRTSGTFRSGGVGTGNVGIVSGNTTQAGYIEWRVPDNTRMGYMGWVPTVLTLQLENGYNYSIMGGNVGIGTSSPAARLHVAGSGSGTVDLQVTGRIRTGDGAGHGGVWLTSGDEGFVGNNGGNIGFWTNGVGWDAFQINKSTGNVGIGMSAPSYKLDVAGKERIRTSGQSFTAANTGALELSNAGSGAAYISFHREGVWGAHFGLDTDNWFSTQGWSAGSGYTNLRAGHIRGTGDVFADGIVYWGNSGSRTEFRNDAGLMGSAGARSGFFETPSPSPAANWPAGASSWWHLLDVRHSNGGNNYAMQFAGSFFDQRLFFRKTENNPAKAWSEIHNTAVFAETTADVDRGGSTAIITVLTTPSFEVRAGERYLINVVADFRHNSGSGEDRWRIFLNRNNLGGCTTAEIGRQVTPDVEADHNNWHSFSHQFVWIADCSGTINLSLLVQRFESDDSWRTGTARIIASRF